MKKSKIPTLIGIGLLVLGLSAAVFLVRNKQIFRLGASSDEVPKDVRISNISDSSFTVSWTTNKETVGFIVWGDTDKKVDRIEEDTIGTSGLTHYVTVRSLSAQTNYFFKINSNGVEYDNNSSMWQVATGPTLPESGSATRVSGSVLTATGETSSNTLVYLTIGGGNLLSTVTSQNGSWLISLSSLRTQNLKNYFVVNELDTLLEISANAGLGNVSSAQIYLQSANPIPAMILGQVHDFKNLKQASDESLPLADINLPDQTTRSSGFNIESTDNIPPTETVTLESIDEGEIISTVEPEFFGEGPKGTALTISIESELQTDTVNVSSTGDWKWSPPNNLEPGSHKITVSWRDAGGILRTITRNFVVSASEYPAFEATPSATPTISSTTTPKPTTTVKPTTTPTATRSATATPISTFSALPEQPVSGNLTPTIILSIMGIGSMIFGLLLWKKSEA